MSYTRIICIDFDGVIHSYSSGWQGAATVADLPVPGAFAWLNELLDDPGFKPVIYSSRSKEDSGINAMQVWFGEHGFARVSELEFPTQKPAAYLTVDDRALMFQGVFPELQWMLDFKAWNKR